MAACIEVRSMSITADKPTAIILAAGLSQRMGENKLLLDLNGKPLIEYLLEALPYDLFHTVIVVLANDTASIVERKNYRIESIINTTPERGQNFSITLGLRNSPFSIGYCFFVADQPFISRKTIEALAHTFLDNPHKIVIPQVEGQNGNPVFFPSCCRQELLELRGDSGGKTVIKNHPEKVLLFPCNNRQEFFDIDTPEEFILAQQMLTER